jgi:transcriptional regulator with XRE-family HTH domain
MPPPLRRASSGLPDKILKILAARRLSLSEVSRASRSLAPGSPLQQIPHNLYSLLRKRQFSPSLYQLFALSTLTGYRLADWLAVFGFSLDDIPRFQVTFPALRTVELDARVYQYGRSIPWFSELQAPDFSAPLIPLSRWLALTTPRTFRSVPHGVDSVRRYVKIGSQDAFAFPDLLPGSIVRINLKYGSLKRPTLGNTHAKRLFLVEHSKGLACARLIHSAAGKFVLCSRQLPYAAIELQEGNDAAVLGVADLEIRPLANIEKPVVPARLGRYWTPAPLATLSHAGHVGEFIRKARTRSGLSFREASQRTRLMARSLGDPRYYCAPGSLSDFETRQQLPRHVQKIIAICAVYFASAMDMLEVSGIRMAEAGKLSLPAEFLPRPSNEIRYAAKSSPFFKVVRQRFGRVPYFLGSSLKTLFGLPDFSIRDVFWAGDVRRRKHSGLAGALFLAVDRKQKIPRPSLSLPAWQQPIYVLLRRDGTYLCGFCSLQNGSLILRPCATDLPRLLRLRNRVDAEVVGRVIGIVRRLQ